MITDVSSFTIIVRDQDEALQFYTEKLGFEKRMDMPMGPGKHWVTVAPRDARVMFVLQPHDWFEGEEKEAHKKLLGKSPTIVLRVDNCQETYDRLSQRGVEFIEAPKNMGYGVQAIIKDLYGNTLVLLEQPA